MKKLILGVALMLSSTFAFANNSLPVEQIVNLPEVELSNTFISSNLLVKDVIKDCYLLVTIRDKNGNVISSEMWIVTDVPANYTCQEVGQKVLEILSNSID